jgi:hypothetical protein
LFLVISGFPLLCGWCWFVLFLRSCRTLHLNPYHWILLLRITSYYVSGLSLCEAFGSSFRGPQKGSMERSCEGYMSRSRSFVWFPMRREGPQEPTKKVSGAVLLYGNPFVSVSTRRDREFGFVRLVDNPSLITIYATTEHISLCRRIPLLSDGVDTTGLGLAVPSPMCVVKSHSSRRRILEESGSTFSPVQVCRGG